MHMQNVEKNKSKSLNVRIFPIYKMISWDLLFYYSIIFLYLVEQKGLSASEVLLADTIYVLIIMLVQIPASKIIDKLGKKHSVIIANLCVSIATFLLIIITNFSQLVCVYLIQGFGFAIKGISEDIILYNSLPKGERRGKLFSKINGRASAYYYYIDAISAIITGYLYILNPYLPLIMCLILNIISTIISFKFIHTDEKNMESYKVETKEKIKLKDVCKHVIKSKRLLSLIMVYSLLSGLLYLLTPLRSSLFTELNLKAQYFGIIYAILQIVTGISARLQNVIHNRFRNKTLTFLGMPIVLSCIAIGVVALKTESSKSIGFFVILFFLIIQGVLKGAYRSLIVRYLNNFTNSKIRTKLSTIQNLIYNFVAVVLTIIASLILRKMTSANAFMIIGAISSVLLMLILHYMKDKVGKKPEEYTKEDVKYSSYK